MNLFNPCRKCILRPICQTDCDKYKKFILLFGIMKIHLIVLALLNLAFIPISTSILFQFLDIPINQIDPIILTLLFVIMPVGGYMITVITIDKYYRFDIRKNK